RCSATIDQMRLRRAMNLPLDSQYFSFSGSQSEIQVAFRSPMRDFPFRTIRVTADQKKKPPPKALESVLPQGGGVAYPGRQVRPAVPSAVTARMLQRISSFVPTHDAGRKSRNIS